MEPGTVMSDLEQRLAGLSPAKKALLQARTSLVQAEHDQVVDSYQLLSAVGRLNIPSLGLSVAEYDPRVHFDQVKTKWIGLRTPSGQ